MESLYKECIRVIIDDFLPRKKNFTLNPNFEMQLMRTDTKGVNFDPLTIDTTPQDMLNNLVASIKNIRKNIAVDTSSARIVQIANSMKRTSYLADLEQKFILALRFPNYPLGEKSIYFSMIIEYLDYFMDKFDVVDDLRVYMTVFGSTEAAALRGYVR